MNELNKIILSDFISAMNAGAEGWGDSEKLYQQILETKDTKLIEYANYLKEVL